MRAVLATVATAGLAALAAATGPVAVTAYAAGSSLDGLVPHRAVYEVTLEEASERSGITALKGRMVYESRGAACDGFSVRFRFFQNVRTARREYTSDQRTTTFESPDDKRFDFVNRTYFNGMEERVVKGSATSAGDSVAVALERPEEQRLELSKAVFPLRHLAMVIDAAKSGKRILVTDVFDGSDDGDAVMSTNAIIGRAQPMAETSGADGPEAKLAAVPSWPVSVAYFSGSADASGERLPIYQVSFPLYENGVSGDLLMRYEDYTLKAELTDLSFLEKAACAKE